MSKENELIVLFSLGISPKRVATLFFSIAFLSSLFLLVNSLYLVPTAKNIFKNYLTYKRQEAKLNIKSSEFGQKFDNWYLFINKKESKNFSDIVMLNVDKEKNEENFMLSKSANIANDGGIIKLKLDGGKIYHIKKDAIFDINYDNLTLTNKLFGGVYLTTDIKEYWQKIGVDKKVSFKFNFYILVSLFPLAAIFFAISFGVVNPRYEGNAIYFELFLLILAYFGTGYVISAYLGVKILAIFIALFFLSSLIYFKKEILKRY
jgi:lipopolysaccharide export system permease protein